MVDCNQRAREQIVGLVSGMPVTCEQFDSADCFIRIESFQRPGCIVANGCMPGSSGYKVHQHLLRHPVSPPLILIAHDLDVYTAVRFMEQNVFSLLENPYANNRMTSVINSAVCHDAKTVGMLKRFYELQQLEQSLNDNERVVLEALTKGALNRHIAQTMDLSIRTVEKHRANMIRKFSVNSALEAVAEYSEFRVLSETIFRVDGPSKRRLLKSAMQRISSQ